MAALAKLKLNRRGLRLNVDNFIKKAEGAALVEDHGQYLEMVDPVILRLKDLLLRIDDLSSAIQDRVADEADLEGEINDAQQREEGYKDYLANLECKATERRKKRDGSVVSPGAGSGFSRAGSGANSQLVTSKLPKLEMQKFHGHLLEWKAFWDRFTSSVHSRTDLPNVDKFNYLVSFLRGKAKDIVSGISVTNENYGQAVAILTERYGNEESIVFEHFRQMIKLPAVVAHDFQSLESVYEKLEQHIRSLLSLNVEQAQLKTVIPIVLSKLPDDVCFTLEREKVGGSWDLKTLRNKLKEWVMAREAVSRNSDSPPSRFGYPPSGSAAKGFGKFGGQKPGGWAPMRATVGTLAGGGHRQSAAPAVAINRCAFCGEGHWSDACRVHASRGARISQLRNQCFQCLKDGHVARGCPNPRECCYCGRLGHHRSLCARQFGQGASGGVGMVCGRPLGYQFKGSSCVGGDVRAGGAAGHGGSAGSGAAEHVMMETAAAAVRNPSNRRCARVRIYLDGGCHRSYLRATVARGLGLRVHGPARVGSAVFGTSRVSTIDTRYATVELELADGCYLRMQVSVIPEITAALTRVPVGPAARRSLDGYRPLADKVPVAEETFVVDLLLGQDIYHELVRGSVRNVDDRLVVLESRLGWILCGPFINPDYQVSGRGAVLGSLLSGGTILHEWDERVRQSFELEGIGVREDGYIKDDDRALEQFNRSVELKDGRYHVSWPWRDPIDDLPSNYGLAMGRLKSVHRRLLETPEVMEKYNQIIETQVTRGIIEEVKDGMETGRVKHYIPHHPVFNPESKTTPIRIVYDGSAKVAKADRSLNERMLRGLGMLSSLVGILLRFRLPKLAVLSDIEKAFLMIALHIPDRDVTRFLWFKEPALGFRAGNLLVYRFCRVPFGFKASMFLLTAVVFFHLNGKGSDVAVRLKENNYVDNIFGGAESTEQLLKYYAESKQIFREASMNLREWCSNDADFLAQIPEEDRADGCLQKVMGLKWNTKEDQFIVPGFKSATARGATSKKELLQGISRIYDPLGYFSPVVLRGRLLLQEVTERRALWDGQLTDDEMRRWRGIEDDVLRFRDVPFGRYLPPIPGGRCEIHCFTDASARAYGCAVYLRFCSGSEARSSLVFSKARVGPSKPLTIPRMELMGVLIGVRCLQFVETELRLSVSGRFLWSDSKCVLHWVVGTQLEPVFVENRLREIRRLEGTVFGYVKTNENPADMATKGHQLDDLVRSDLWWTGPSWLADPSATLSPFVPTEPVEAGLGGLVGAPLEAGADEVPGFDASLYGTWERLVRVVAWVMRFRDRCRGSAPLGPYLEAREVSLAEKMVIRQVQSEHYCGLVDALRARRSVGLQFRRLGCHLDRDGIICCKGRLGNSGLTGEATNPVLLPRGSRVTVLIVQHFHRKLMHAGVSQTLSVLRSYYWITQGRACVWKEVHRCGVCKRWEGLPYGSPPSPDLPDFRVSFTRAFAWVGLDYFGPLYVRDPTRGSGAELKSWVCLFTCASIRAVHMELVLDMTVSGFLLAFRRFVARRGVPVGLVSDNASQFKASRNVLDRLKWDVQASEDVHSYVSQQRIQWRFIVEAAPFMGGFYERMVGIVKRALKKSVGSLSLTTCQLSTVLVEAEAVVNSRPLTYVGSDFEGRVHLTPAHFLGVGGVRSLPDPEVDVDRDYVKEPTGVEVLRAWKRGQAHMDTFWVAWRDEYLLSLREKWRDGNRQRQVPAAGDIVLVGDKLPRGRWRLAKVEGPVESSDGKIRAVRLRMTDGKVRQRSTTQVYPVECKGDEQGQRCEDRDEQIEGAGAGDARVPRRAAVQARERIGEQARQEGTLAAGNVAAVAKAARLEH